MLYNLFRSAHKGEIAPENPWGSKSIEWTISSPPPVENFDTIPIITEDPYSYS